MRRAVNLPRSSYGTLLAHFGIGLMVVGIVGTTAYQDERILVMKPGETVNVGGYDATFKGAQPERGPNYREDIAAFDITRNGAAVTTLEPSKRVYDAPPQPTTEAGIHASWRGDLYLVIGDRAGRCRRLRGARLFQSAGALHLDRRADHVHRRRLVVVGSPFARRCAGEKPPAQRPPAVPAE